MRVQQIEHECCDPLTVLHQRVEAFGKRGPRSHAAGRALAVVGAMFGDDRRLLGGQIEYLTSSVVACGHGRHQRRKMLFHPRNGSSAEPLITHAFHDGASGALFRLSQNAL
jgi:hypothetical protein